jgi:stress-induced morphogen
MEPDIIKSRLEEAFSDATIKVNDLTGTKDHYDVVIISEAFTGVSAIERHRKVYALFPEMGGALHAMKLTTRTPAEVA